MWSLTFPDQHPHFLIGPDDAERAELCTGLIESHKNNPDKKCLQVGVPSWMDSNLGTSFVSIDLHDQRPCIDFKEDLANTGFESNTFDFILCNAILEHVQDPFGCVNEMERILKPGGLVWAEIPFVQPYHPYKTYQLEDGYLPKQADGLLNDQDHGGDYWRFTPQGLRLLFKNFELIRMLCIGDGGIVFYGSKK